MVYKTSEAFQIFSSDLVYLECGESRFPDIIF